MILPLSSPRLPGMTVGGCKALVVKPSYGYRHPDCSMSAPPGVPADAKLHFTLELVHVLPGSEVSAVRGLRGVQGSGLSPVVHLLMSGQQPPLSCNTTDASLV